MVKNYLTNIGEGAVRFFYGTLLAGRNASEKILVLQVYVNGLHGKIFVHGFAGRRFVLDRLQRRL
ncbi:hypothetical protein JZU57_00185, partial [bacterium]|nr:hypothetical protein [bacterium]